MDSIISAINTGIASSTEGVTSTLTTNLPVVFGVFGALVGLGLALYYFRKLVGHK